MRKDKPSRTAYKVALNVVALGAKPGMGKVLPPGIVEATERLLVASGAATERVTRWSRSPRTVAIYEWFDWMLPGQFEAFAYIPTGEDGRPDAGRWTGLMLWTLKVSGEPWLWSTRPEELSAFLEEAGWTSHPDLVGASAKHGVEIFGVAVK